MYIVRVAMIIIGLSAMNGFERELQNRVLSVIPHGEFEGVEGRIEDWQSVANTAKKHPAVIAAAPYVRFTALLEKGQKIKAVEIRGVDPDLEGQVSNMSEFIGQAWAHFEARQNQIILAWREKGLEGGREWYRFLRGEEMTESVNVESLRVKRGVCD